jgi:gamma-glutamylcyclotransferase
METDNIISYFAYGSNMPVKRLQERIPSARPIGAAKLENYVFSCNKKSITNSGKGNITAKINAITWGVIYQFPISDISKLDGFEKGYTRITVSAQILDARVSCVTYKSENITLDLPFGWYMHYILTGALEFNLPNEYIRFLADIPVKKDVTKHKGIATYKKFKHG